MAKKKTTTKKTGKKSKKKNDDEFIHKAVGCAVLIHTADLFAKR